MSVPMPTLMSFDDPWADFFAGSPMLRQVLTIGCLVMAAVFAVILIRGLIRGPSDQSARTKDPGSDRSEPGED